MRKVIDEEGNHYEVDLETPVGIRVSGAIGHAGRVQFVFGHNGSAICYEVDTEQARRIAIQLLAASGQALGLTRDEMINGLSPKTRAVMDRASITEEAFTLIDRVFDPKPGNKDRQQFSGKGMN